MNNTHATETTEERKGSDNPSGMPPTTPSTTGPAASAQTRLRSRRLSVGNRHPDVIADAGLLARRDGVLSGLEDHNINDAQLRQYSSNNSNNSGNPRKSARAEEPLPTGSQDGAGGRGTRMVDKSQTRQIEQSNHRSAREERAAASLPTTTNGARAEAGASFSMASRGKTKV